MDVDVNQALTNAFVDELEKLSNQAGGGYFGSAGMGSGAGSVPTGSRTSVSAGGRGTEGMPGYRKGGPVKKDGYLTDKQGRPYAQVHKGERVLPPLKDKLR